MRLHKSAMRARLSNIAAHGATAIVAVIMALAILRTSPIETAPAPTPQGRHILELMHQFQLYAEKLHVAGQRRNAVLAEWYLWKIRQGAADIAEGRIQPYAYNGWDAAELVTMIDEPALALETRIKRSDWTGFDADYQRLVDRCNACHVATEHPFIVIRTPRDVPVFSNQNYGE